MYQHLRSKEEEEGKAVHPCYLVQDHGDLNLSGVYRRGDVDDETELETWRPAPRSHWRERG